jgi:hypothetical protein
MKKRHLIAGVSGLATAAVAAKLLMRPEDVDWEQNRNVIFHAAHSRFIEVDGVRVHYQQAGDIDSPPMILIHGFASSTLVWSKVLLELGQAGFRVIAPDMLGYGYSGKPKQLDYTIGSQARMIVGLMDNLGIESATVVGSSYGGAVAATMALDYPERVDKLALVGAVTNNAVCLARPSSAISCRRCWWAHGGCCGAGSSVFMIGIHGCSTKDGSTRVTNLCALQEHTGQLFAPSGTGMRIAFNVRRI